MTSLADRKSLLEKIPPFPPRPVGGYGLIYPDCPWAYRDKANSGDRGASHKYPVLSLSEIKALRPEVQKAASENCALALWATAPMMGEAREVLAAWGFKYSTILITWIKSTKTADRLKAVAKTMKIDVDILTTLLAKEGLTVMRPKKGMGNWTRSNAEFLLLGIQGKVVRASKSVGSVIVSEPREHSRKPDEARAMLEELFGDIPRLEMFSRASAPGWSSWGLEAGVFDEDEKEDSNDPTEGGKYVYCQGCSETGGGERGIYHKPPACPSDEELGGLDAAAKANPEAFESNDWDDTKPAT